MEFPLADGRLARSGLSGVASWFVNANAWAPPAKQAARQDTRPTQLRSPRPLARSRPFFSANPDSELEVLVEYGLTDIRASEARPSQVLTAGNGH
jgi:hypothetical protein